MKNKKVTIIALFALVLVLLTSVFFVVFLNIAEANETATAEAAEQTDVTSFSAYTDVEIFQNVPAMVAPGTYIGEATDSGGNYYMITVSGTSEKNYEDYLKVLEEAGYKKHSDNGEDKMEGYARTASYTKDDVTLTVSHASTLEKTYISAGKDVNLSEHLIYKDEYVADNISGAQTKLYLLELISPNGNGYVIQLKNGHFIIHDGGTKKQAPYLLDFLEELTPGDEKPVVEAWFVTHSHADHHGALVEIATTQDHASRVIVQGVYFMAMSKEFIETTSSDYVVNKLVATSAKVFDNGQGGKSKLYRPQFGQRYYFNDIVIDVSLTPEQYELTSLYVDDFNDSSFWLKHHIEGQTFMVGGDSAHAGCRTIMNMFDQSYMDVDVYSVLHHGINVYEYFIDFIKADTVLYTNWRFGSTYQDKPSVISSRLEENAKLQEKATECYHYGDGTVELTFPYTVGTAKTWEKNAWIYDGGKADRTAPTDE